MILVISDIHCRYSVVNEQVRHAEETMGMPVDQIIAIGDLGIFEDERIDSFRRIDLYRSPHGSHGIFELA